MAKFSHMVDIHCHYLPAVDDGAANLAEGLDLVRAAQRNGISRILLTPHIHIGRYENTLASLRLRFETFRRAVLLAKIPVELGLAAEVRLGDELIGLLERDELPLLIDARGDKTLLLELPHSHVPPGTDQLVRWLLKKNIRPLLAHPERNKELISRPERVRNFCKEGCLTQITAAAVIGRFGRKSEQMAHWLLDNDLVTLMATDAHNEKHRPPLLREAAQWVAQRFGDEHAWRLAGAVPASLTTGNFYRSPAPRRKLDQEVAVTEKNCPAVPILRDIASGGNNNAALRGDVNAQAFSDMRAQLLTHAARLAAAKATRTQRH